MDNRQFNINGRTKEQLELAIKCLMLDEYGGQRKVSGYYFSKKKGLVLTQYNTDGKTVPFTNRMGVPTPMTASELTELLYDWLESPDANDVILDDFERDYDDDDVSTELGWRLYTEQWGHILEDNDMTLDHSSIAAFKPIFCWYGK